MMYQKGNPRILLSILWIFIILNFFARDIHELGRPGMLEQMMSGTIDGVVVTEMLMLLGEIMISGSKDGSVLHRVKFCDLIVQG